MVFDMMGMRYRKSAHGIYKKEYHLVWIARYLRKIFVKGVKEYAAKTLGYLPDLDPDIEVIKLSVRIDHVHMVFVVPRKNCSCRRRTVHQVTIGEKA